MEKLEQSEKEPIYLTLHKKMPKYEDFSDPYFPLFRLNMKIYGVNLRIECKYGKIRTTKNSVFGQFSCSGKKCIKMGPLFRFFMSLLSVSSC